MKLATGSESWALAGSELGSLARWSDADFRVVVCPESSALALTANAVGIDAGRTLVKSESVRQAT